MKERANQEDKRKRNRRQVERGGVWCSTVAFSDCAITRAEKEVNLGFI